MIRASLSPLPLALSLAVLTSLAACSSSTPATAHDAGAHEASTKDATARDATAKDAARDTGKGAGEDAGCVAADAGALSDAGVALGLALVTSHKCTTCHGPKLGGNDIGVLSTAVDGGRAYPPNLTPDLATGLGCWTNAQIEEAILNGIDNGGQPLCAPMPRFGHVADGGLTDAQAAAVVEYLRSLPTVVNNVPETPNCTAPDAGVDGGVDAAPDATADAKGDATHDAAATADAKGDALVDARTDGG